MCCFALQSNSLKRHLVIIERTINLNTYQRKQALYRNFEPIIGLFLASWRVLKYFLSFDAAVFLSLGDFGRIAAIASDSGLLLQTE